MNAELLSYSSGGACFSGLLFVIVAAVGNFDRIGVGGVFLLCGGCVLGWLSLREQANEDYAAFYKRVGIRNPDRVQHVYDRLTPAGRSSIRNKREFLEDEMRVLAARK